MNAGKQHGFTLMEVLLATTLLAMGLAVALATLRSAITVTTRGETVARENERMRLADGFLRRRLSSALPLGMEMDPARQMPIQFVGEREYMRFVADIPPYLGSGGPHLHELSVEREGEALALRVAFAMVQGGRVQEDNQAREPDMLVGGLRSVRFAYRGLDAQGVLGPWQETWGVPEALPLQVSVEMQLANGQAWPPLTVSLPHSDGGRAPPGGLH